MIFPVTVGLAVVTYELPNEAAVQKFPVLEVTCCEFGSVTVPVNVGLARVAYVLKLLEVSKLEELEVTV